MEHLPPRVVDDQILVVSVAGDVELGVVAC